MYVYKNIINTPYASQNKVFTFSLNQCSVADPDPPGSTSFGQIKINQNYKDIIFFVKYT